MDTHATTKHRYPWTAKDDALLAGLYSGGNLGDVAAKLGRTRAAVWARAHILGLAHDADHLKGNRKMDPADRPALVERYAAGELAADLAEEFGISRQRVYQLTTAAGVRKRRGSLDRG